MYDLPFLIIFFPVSGKRAGSTSHAGLQCCPSTMLTLHMYSTSLDNPELKLGIAWFNISFTQFKLKDPSEGCPRKKTIGGKGKIFSTN